MSDKEIPRVGDTILITGEGCLSRGMEVVVKRIDERFIWFRGKQEYDTNVQLDSPSYKLVRRAENSPKTTISDSVCPDCKGKGEVLMLNWPVPCDCQKGTK